MYSIKIENGHSAISGSSVKLRTKFIKHFPSLQIQQNVIQTIGKFEQFIHLGYIQIFDESRRQ